MGYQWGVGSGGDCEKAKDEEIGIRDKSFHCNRVCFHSRNKIRASAFLPTKARIRMHAVRNETRNPSIRAPRVPTLKIIAPTARGKRTASLCSAKRN